MSQPTSSRIAQLQQLFQQGRSLLTPLNLHFAGVGLLALVNLYLLVHMLFAWQSARSQDAAAVANQTKALHSAEHAAQPLRGLDQKLAAATTEANRFYQKRLPYQDSQIIEELGELATKQGIKMTRVSYAPEPVLEDTAGQLTQLRMDASLSGDYRPLMLFINSLERDKMFFHITGVTLSGQQSGNVTLRLRFESYMRPPSSEDTAAKHASDEKEAAQ